MIQAIAFTAYPISEMERSRAFYEGLLGLKPASNFHNVFQEYELGESTFSIGVMSEHMPDFYKSRGASVAFEVADLDAMVEKMRQNGVTILYGPQEFPTCRMCVIADPDNNAITLHALAGKGD